MSAQVQAVVVRWRGGDEAAACLRSLLAHGGSKLGRITLVDSGSGDGGAERLAAAFPQVEVVALPANLSFAHAANRGAAAGTEELLLLLNPDLELQPGAVDALTARLDGCPETAGAVPLLTGADGRSQHRWQLRRLPGPLRLASGRGGAATFTSPPTAALPVPQPAAAAWLLRRRVWEALGGLDEGFAPAWWEDVDFCARLAAGLRDGQSPAGGGFVVEPAARMRHRGGSSVAALGDAAFLSAYHRNLLRYAARHHPDALARIRLGLQLALAARALLRPQRAAAYRAALAATREL